MDEDDGFYGPTDEFFYSDEWELENAIDDPFEATPFEDDCYEMGY